MTKKTLQIGLLTCVAVLVAHFCQGQSAHADNWVFPRGNAIDFSSGVPQPYGSSIPAFGSLTQGTSAISDLDGNLVLYSNGDSAWNNQHLVIQGGTNLAGSEEATQSSIIIPAPNSPNRYYIFTMDDNGTSDGLHYYLVDMSFNAGAGLVFPGTQLDSFMTEKLCAVKHGNDFDYWIVAHRFDSDEFVSFHVDSFGVNSTPVVSAVGLTHSGNTNAVMGQMKISPDGSKIALAGFQGGHIELLSFDNESGEVSAPLTLESYSSNFPFGVEFSPDSRKLYYVQRFSANPEAILFQYDLDHLDTNCLLDSQFELAQVNELKVPSNLQLGNNGKIYMTVNYFSNYDTLSVINQPNLYGNDADFVELGISLDSAITEGLVNFPSSYLSDGIYVEHGTTCDGMPTIMYPEDSLSPDSVNWNFGDPSSTSNTSSDVYTTHTFSNPDTFLVTLLTFTGNQIDTFYRNVVVWDTIIDLLGNDTTICNGGSDLVLDATWHNACVYWSTGATTDTITVNTGGVYWVDVYYQSCLFRDSVDVEGVSGPPNFSLGSDTAVCSNFSFILDPDLSNAYYTWQDGSHDTTFNVGATGTYSLSATNACGSTVDTLLVTVNQSAQPIINFPEDTTVCDSVGLLLNVAFENAVYAWSNATTDSTLFIDSPGLYSVTVGNICDTVSDTIQVYIDAAITGNLIPIEVICDEDDTIELAVQNGDSVTWSNGTFGNSINATEAGTFWYSQVNTCGIYSDTMIVVEWDTAFTLNVGLDTVLCLPNTLVTIGPDSTKYPFTYLWNDGSSKPNLLAGVGQHELTATNRCASLVDLIQIWAPDQIAIATPAGTNVCDGEVVQLSILSEAISNTTWSNGEVGFTIDVEVADIYSATALDTNGCLLSDSALITSNCPSLVSLDNVFTPNQDGINDLYCLRIENVESATIEIYNRWGLLIQSTISPELCWDGKISGDNAQEGVYFYNVETRNFDGTTANFRGSFSLLR